MEGTKKNYDVVREKPQDLPSDQMDYPSMDELEETKKEREKEDQEKADRDLRESYPTQWSEKMAELKTGSPKGDLGNQDLADLEPQDQENMNILLGHLERDEYEDLGNKVETELRALGLNEEDLRPELDLLDYARKYAGSSPEWRAWIKKAVYSIFSYKKSRKKV